VQPEGLIAIGRLTKPHGLRGDVVFLPYVYDLEVWREWGQTRCFQSQEQDGKKKKKLEKEREKKKKKKKMKRK